MANRRRPSNHDIASQLLEVARVLRADDDDKWRARAYQEAARTLIQLEEPIVGIFDREGRAGLVALPAIGQGIAKRIEEMVYGRDPRSEQLSIFDDPDDEPTVRDQPAFVSEGPRRAVRDLFDGGGESVPESPADPRPPIALLLHIDRRFRERVEADRAERTSGEWLPTWRLQKGGWEFTVRFSDTKAAHRMGRTHDWVVVEYERDGDQDTYTVVTEYRGPLSGRRVVRGRERESLRYWAHETERQVEEKRWARNAS